MLLLFKTFNKKRIKGIIFLLSAMFTCSVLNALAAHSDKIEKSVRQIENSGQQLFYFEKNFLIKYLNSDYNFGELFEKKMCEHVSKKIKLYGQEALGSEDLQKAIDVMLRLNFSKCLLDYLEDKYIIQFDTSGIKEKYFKILILSELEENQKNMFKELTHIIELIEDNDAKKFILANTGINENIANYIFSSRLFCDENYKRKAKKVLITVNPTKEPAGKITYSFFDDSGKELFCTNVSKKVFGAQFGGVLSITKSVDNTEEKRFFKTHQDGSRFTGFSGKLFNSKSISLAKSVNVEELLIYKLLEKLKIGPEVKFIVNPFVNNDIYIVTKDLGKGDGIEFEIAGKIPGEMSAEFKNDKQMILQFTIFDLISRVLGINDLNPGNYGVQYNGNNKLVKILDFRAPYQPMVLNNITFKSYFNANGGIYIPGDKVAKIVLSNRSKDQKNQDGKEALKVLNISKEEFKEIVNDSKSEINEIMNKTDTVSERSVRDQLGLTASDFENLDVSSEIIIQNFDFITDYFNKV